MPPSELYTCADILNVLWMKTTRIRFELLASYLYSPVYQNFSINFWKEKKMLKRVAQILQGFSNAIYRNNGDLFLLTGFF